VRYNDSGQDQPWGWPDQGASEDPTKGSNIMDVQAKYKVDLNSVLGCQMDGVEHHVVCENFGEAKACAVDAFELAIDRLTYLCEQIKAADAFEDLDLGWWEPLFEKIEGDSHAEEKQYPSD
jgi:hypothetical protein